MVGEHDVFLVPSQFPTIGEAIEAVVRPATIMIGPGVYQEDLRVIGKEYVVIQSARLSRRGVTLAGNDASSVITIEGSVVHLSGIEIRSNQRARGLAVVESAVSLQECVLVGNRVAGHSDGFGAGMLCRGSEVRVQKSTIAGNTLESMGAAAGGGGLHLVDCTAEIAGSSIQTNAVYASTAARGGGIWCERSKLRMWRSRVTDNVMYAPVCEGAGIYFMDAVAAQIGGSVITGNGSVDGRGGGVFIRGNPQGVAIHRNTVVGRNHPGDLEVDHESLPAPGTARYNAHPCG